MQERLALNCVVPDTPGTFVLTDGTFKVEMKLRELFSGNITNIHVNLDEPRVIVS